MLYKETSDLKEQNPKNISAFKIVSLQKIFNQIHIAHFTLSLCIVNETKVSLFFVINFKDQITL